MDGILANVEIAPDKTLQLQGQIADQRFTLRFPAGTGR